MATQQQVGLAVEGGELLLLLIFVDPFGDVVLQVGVNHQIAIVAFVGQGVDILFVNVTGGIRVFIDADARVVLVVQFG